MFVKGFFYDSYCKKPETTCVDLISNGFFDSPSLMGVSSKDSRLDISLGLHVGAYCCPCAVGCCIYWSTVDLADGLLSNFAVA